MKNDHQASLKRKREENQKLVRTVPRKASLKHVLRVNHYVSMLNTDGLRMFRNIDKLKDWGLHEGCQTGKFPEPMPRIPAHWVPASLSVCTDQEQTQVTGGEFIFGEKPDGLGCTGARLSDDFHREQRLELSDGQGRTEACGESCDLDIQHWIWAMAKSSMVPPDTRPGSPPLQRNEK